MKPTDLLPFISTITSINNGWAFAAFLVVIVVTIYLSRQKVP